MMPAHRPGVIAIDPGEHPGYVWLLAGGTLHQASHKRESWVDAEGGWQLAVTEGQWIYPDSDADPADILKLAFRAGWQLRGVAAAQYMRIPPKVWRGNTSANKRQVQNRIIRTLTPDERALFKNIPKSKHGDVLDAIGIARAAQRLTKEGNHDYDWK